MDNNIPKPKYIGLVQGTYSGLFDTYGKAEDWVSKMLDQKSSVVEGYVLETVARVRKASPPLEVQRISPRADQTPVADKDDASYSNMKLDAVEHKPFGSTHTGKIGAGYDFG